MMRKSLFLMFSFTLVFTGCVWQSDYDALKAEHETLQDSFADYRKTSEANTMTLEQAIEAEKKRVAALEKAKKKLEGDLAKLIADKSALEGSVEDMQRALAELERRQAEADARIAEFQALLDKFKALIDAGKLKVRIREGRMIVELATDILFKSGKAGLSKEGVMAIQEVTQVFLTIPDRKFQIEGHTDNVPMSGDTYRSNWELASARALNVLHAMLEAGMSPNRISAASYGESIPVETNETPEGRAANRRIEIVIVPDLSSLPGFDELDNLGK